MYRTFPFGKGSLPCPWDYARHGDMALYTPREQACTARHSKHCMHYIIKVLARRYKTANYIVISALKI
jgi:hypothetical protein